LRPRRAQRAAVAKLAGGQAQPAFVGAFAYASGSPPGVRLDDLLPGWRWRRAESDLGDLLASANNRTPANGSEANIDAVILRLGLWRMVFVDGVSVWGRTLLQRAEAWSDGPAARGSIVNRSIRPRGAYFLSGVLHFAREWSLAA